MRLLMIKNLYILSLFLSATCFFASTHTATFDITNSCPFTVWAATVPSSDRQLNPSQTWPLDVSRGTKGARIWARTGCKFNSAGKGSCDIGDYGGLLQCQGYGQAPNTLTEYALNQFNNLDFFDFSLVDGFNIPMENGVVNSSTETDPCIPFRPGKHLLHFFLLI